MQEALFWEKQTDGSVRCLLCPHACRIAEGKTGICGVRRNMGTTLMSLVYGRAVAASVDPIEKKPLFHILPGSRAYSIATLGCNLQCAFCQNSDISQMPRETGRIVGDDLPPPEVVKRARASGSACISYTYTEPTIFLEYVLDCARIAKQAGILNTMVSNGFINADIVRAEFPGLIQAANIDLKAFTERFYRDLCKARLAPVLEAIQAYHAAGVWIEITTLLIPGENDDPAELRDIASFIAGISPDIPWHISRYYPRYHYDKAAPTPVAALEKARDTGLAAGLNYVYSGNVPGQASEHTYCPECGKAVIERVGFSIQARHMQGGACAFCGAAIAGVF